MFAKAAKDPELLKVLESQGTGVQYLNSKNYAAFLKKAYDTHKTVAVNLGIAKK